MGAWWTSGGGWGKGGGQAFGLPIHHDDFPEGNPKENPYLPDIGYMEKHSI